MMRRIVPLLFAALLAASAQKYEGPTPPHKDLPYLKHADNLIPTEAVTAKQEDKKDETIYTIDGASSTARTPLAEPVFLFDSDKIAPEKLQLFRLDSKGGHREIRMSKKKSPEPIRMEVKRLSGNLFRIEVDESLDPGEYSLSPSDSNQAFCFQVF